MVKKPGILERLRIPCTDRSCEDCDADRIDAAGEIERLRVYEAEELASSILGLPPSKRDPIEAVNAANGVIKLASEIAQAVVVRRDHDGEAGHVVAGGDVYRVSVWKVSKGEVEQMRRGLGRERGECK